MGFLYAFGGAAMGVGLQLYSNAVRKLPLLRSPWMHAAFLGTGAYLGSKVEGWEKATTDKINAQLEKSNRVTLPGTK
eukprot:CAMPEP_0195517814 /NCGR_PEP_ID=MMETSP0794_2-20130614/11748_1 /TAXON_ID=515487 /ORGANISM="Stephanopyxis turris, Strain CCMP 815" /LENGTH=76 /DNA_ID=CAMNT_0040646687 /DNA_START=65 /DNA_END=295 /DNA_ORIENTATION=+